MRIAAESLNSKKRRNPVQSRAGDIKDKTEGKERGGHGTFLSFFSIVMTMDFFLLLNESY